MTTKIIVANWKAHLAPQTVDSWLREFGRDYMPSTGIHVVLAVPFLMMRQVAEAAGALEQVSLAAQGVSPFPPGSYTGATPAKWLKGLAAYALVGHRERRRYFHEDNQTVAAQVRECVAAGICPIVCLDRNNRSSQLAALDTADLERCLLAFTPDSAVSLELAAEKKVIAEAAASLGRSAAGGQVLYGGGVNRENAGELLHLEGIGGLLVGRACQSGKVFAELVNDLG